jgi:hypothetical protein
MQNGISNRRIVPPTGWFGLGRLFIPIVWKVAIGGAVLPRRNCICFEEAVETPITRHLVIAIVYWGQIAHKRTLSAGIIKPELAIRCQVFVQNPVRDIVCLNSVEYSRSLVGTKIPLPALRIIPATAKKQPLIT